MRRTTIITRSSLAALAVAALLLPASAMASDPVSLPVATDTAAATTTTTTTTTTDTSATADSPTSSQYTSNIPPLGGGESPIDVPEPKATGGGATPVATSPAHAVGGGLPYTGLGLAGAFFLGLGAILFGLVAHLRGRSAERRAARKIASADPYAGYEHQRRSA